MEWSDKFIDYTYFISKKDLLDYITSVKLPKTYILKYDPVLKRKTKREYWDFPCSFDIETTSFYVDGKKYATMYLWGFNLNGRSIYGRTWDEFFSLLNTLHDILNTEQIKLIIWCHNLSYEYQWFRKWLEWKEVFALKDHEVARAVSTLGIEFRCSLLESGKKLSLLAKEIKENPIKKLDTLEYRGLRHSKTPLTDLELMYQLNDVRIVSNYIYEKGKKRKGICKILLTKTGYVREKFRDHCIWNSEDRNKGGHYRKLMNELTLEPEEYVQNERTFQGALTHGNYLDIGDILYDVGSYDEISAYIAALAANMYPMSKGVFIEVPSPEEIKAALSSYCSIFRWEVWEIRQKEDVFENPISESHCEELINPLKNNGRIKYAAHLVTWICNVDLEIYKEFYDWDKDDISNLWRYRKSYLPKPFIEVMLDLYKTKTTLKGLKGADINETRIIEELYLLSKENLNSCYGMIAYKFYRAIVKYENDEYISEMPDVAEVVEKENKSRRRFIFYPWAIFCTAFSRKALLLGGIKPCGRDYHYSDTDSVKCSNPEQHREHFNQYNEEIRKKLYKCLDFHGLDHELIEPLTADGKRKLLGAYEYEHDERPYDLFKCLGSKRYMTYTRTSDLTKQDIIALKEKYGKIIPKDVQKTIDNWYAQLEITIAGLGKISGRDFIIENGDDPEDWFNFFSDEMEVPPEKTGKLTHTYIDDDINTVLVDMFGDALNVYEKSCIHLEPCSFNLSLSKDFIKFLAGYKEDYGLYGDD